MAAFEKILSGIEEFDQCIDYIRLGDNVVFRVSNLDEFRLFMEPYLKQAIKDHRNIIYFRFASHEPFIEDCEEVKTIYIPLSTKFETFSIDIHNAIEKEGKDAFYIFDCLSELQTAWSTDLMMGNFFRVTCPFLFQLDTVAYFPIIRGKHSSSAVKKIIDTTQLFFDVYSEDEDTVYVRPEKVWNRHLDTMFMPHVYHPSNGSFVPVKDGVLMSHFYQTLNKMQRPGDEQLIDSWDRFFNVTKILYENGVDTKEQCNRMCDIMLTRDRKMRSMIKKFFTIEDYYMVRNHMIGTGLIGGKACGMLLSRAIIRTLAPTIYAHMEPHDSYFIGSDVYYSYIVNNGFWDLRIRQRKEEEYFSLADTFASHLLNGKFSEGMRQQFRHVLEYYGQDPIIIRSSSILEDGFGNAFAGKYDSVFLANRGSMEERLEAFENAVKQVYASSMSLSALDYRKRRGLDKKDEQMSLLVMRVSGSYYEQLYMPCAAGVGYSYSPYKFLKDCDPSKGMLRLVMGLGTSAVDRSEGSYPRLVNLDNPRRTMHASYSEKHKYSQRSIEAINIKDCKLSKISSHLIEPYIPKYLCDILMEHDYDVERQFRERGQRRSVQFVSCNGLVNNEKLMDDMKQILNIIQSEYNYPVDIEFTINIAKHGEYMINLLQCRPLQVFKDTGKVSFPTNLESKHILLHNVHSSMGLSRNLKLDYIVYVDPVQYYNMPYIEKMNIARLVGKINWMFRNKNKHLFLILPGRIGTSSPELGVGVNFSEISEFDVICEVADSRAGYNPELSYGSHIFQDLVEAQILYTAVFENSKKTLQYHTSYFHQLDNLLTDKEEFKKYSDILYLFDVSQLDCNLYHDFENEKLLITI